VSLTNESAWVATATTAHQFDLDTGVETPLAKFPVPVRSVGWAKAGPVLGTAAGLYVWQASAYVKRLPSGVQDLALDPDGKTVHLAIGKELLQFDFATGKIVARSKSSATGRFLVSSPTGKFVALGREDLAAVLLSTKGYKSVGAVLQDAIPSAIAISPDGQAVAIGGSHSLQILYPFGSKPGIRTRIEGIVNSLAFTPDGDRVIFDQWVPIGPNWLHRLSEWVPASNIDRVLDDDSTIEN
jgi:WD40 repeat protein